MFLAPKLAAILVKAPLRDSPALDGEPNMVRIVFASNIFAEFGVCLGVPPVVCMSLNLFDS